MNQHDIAKLFSATFEEANHRLSAQVFSNSIRFIAVLFMILGVMWCANHFMDSEEKHDDSYLIQLGSRLTKLVIAFMIFILMLFLKEKI